MSFRKTSAVAAVTSAATTVLGTISLGAAYGVVKGIIARNYASSAKAAAGTDNAERIKLTDARGIVFYLDAADRDYKTAEVNLAVGPDLTATGLGYVPVDATGAAVDAAGKVEFVAKSPVTVEVQNAEVATDYFEVSLLVQV